MPAIREYVIDGLVLADRCPGHVEGTLRNWAAGLAERGDYLGRNQATHLLAAVEIIERYRKSQED